MTQKKKKWLTVLLVIAVLGGWVYYTWNFTGSRSGKVLDAATGEPIEGAVVCMQWSGGGFFEIVASGCTAFYETKTDKKGRYYIPTQRVSLWSWFGGPGDEDVMIYKDGYSAYEVYASDMKPVGRSFGHINEKQPYRKKRNTARLYRFNPSDSHTDHLDWIKTFGIYDWPEQLLEKELQQEMEREKEELKHPNRSRTVILQPQ